MWPTLYLVNTAGFRIPWEPGLLPFCAHCQAPVRRLERREVYRRELASRVHVIRVHCHGKNEIRNVPRVELLGRTSYDLLPFFSSEAARAEGPVYQLPPEVIAELDLAL